MNKQLNVEMRENICLEKLALRFSKKKRQICPLVRMAKHSNLFVKSNLMESATQEGFLTLAIHLGLPLCTLHCLQGTSRGEGHDHPFFTCYLTPPWKRGVNQKERTQWIGD